MLHGLKIRYIVNVASTGKNDTAQLQNIY